MGLKVGDDSKAYRYLRRAAFIDLLNMQGNTREGIMPQTPVVFGRQLYLDLREYPSEKMVC